MAPPRNMGHILGDLSVKAGMAELVAMTLFVFIGCGTATTFSSAQGPK